MNWNINHDGDITPLDNGPKVPWWLALEEDYEDFNPADATPTNDD